jgi:small-conductance mechanosensitive channel
VNGQDWSALLGWTLLVVVVYPLLTVAIAEWSRRIDTASQTLRRSIRVVQTLLLPSFAIWLVIGKLTELPPDGLPMKLAETAFGISVLYTLLVFAHGGAAIFAAYSRTPRLLYDIALSVLVMIGGAVIVSTVWGFSFTSLLSVVGVGSVVMGLALQGVIGGVVSGVLLISARQFNIGDWLRTGGNIGRVTQVDWRSVTLQVSPSERLVLPSTGMSSTAFSVIAAGQPVLAGTTVVIGFEHSPEQVRTMLLEAARGVPQLVAPDGARCWVAEYLSGGIRYGVSVSVSDPGRIEFAVDELLSRIWYVAQRHGMSVAPTHGDAGGNLPRYGQTAQQRAELLASAGAFRRLPEGLTEIAELARLQRWRAGETILRQGENINAVFVVLRGAIGMFARSGSSRIDLDCLAAGQIFAIREAFRGVASPVEVVASDETELLSVPAHAVQTLLDHDPALAADMEIMLETRTQALNNLGAVPSAPSPQLLAALASASQR